MTKCDLTDTGGCFQDNNPTSPLTSLYFCLYIYIYVFFYFHACLLKSALLVPWHVATRREDIKAMLLMKNQSMFSGKQTFVMPKIATFCEQIHDAFKKSTSFLVKRSIILTSYGREMTRALCKS